MWWHRRRWLTAKDRTGLVDDRLNMNRGLFGLCGNIATCGNDDEGVCLAVRILEIESAEED